MKSFFRTIIILAGIAIGPGIVMLVYSAVQGLTGMDPYLALLPWAKLLIFIVSGIVSGIIFIFLSRPIVEAIIKFVNNLEEHLVNSPAKTVVAAAVGLAFGLLIAFLLSWPIDRIQIIWISLPVDIIVYILCGYIGVRVAVKTSAKVNRPIFSRGKGKQAEEPFFKETEEEISRPKILDTSVIIDGRIFDICKTGVFEGTIVIPEFVLSELRHIADSADSLKRSKGRRGLDILNKIQKELDIPVEISSVDYDDVAEVDAKLLRMAKDMGGMVVTNDFNLNKVAAVQGVSVFNINDLSNAVKPVLLPGEELSVTILKEGKENGQGIAYLDDGTMIVVENASSRIGQTLEVAVTSVLQTSAGRMIFAKISE